MEYDNKMKGFTIIELLMVIAFVAILAGMVTPFTSSFISRNNYQVTIDRVLSEVWKAQSYAMEGKSVGGNTVWGVCISGSSFRLFNGSCAGPNTKEDYEIPNGITVSGITSVTFDDLRGEPTPVSDIVVSSSYGNTTISLGAAGLVERN